MGSKNKLKQQAELSTEDLIHKVCTEFIDKMEKAMDKKFAVFQDKLNELNTSLTSLRKTVHDNESNILELHKKIDVLEQAARSNTLRICGLQEEKEGESVAARVIHLFASKLDINCSEEDFVGIYRSGRFDGSKNKPRAVIVSFAKKCKRLEVFKAKKELKNTSVYIFEDLTKRRFELLNVAKKKNGPKKAWSMDGNIYVWCERDGKRRMVTCEEDLRI